MKDVFRFIAIMLAGVLLIKGFRFIDTYTEAKRISYIYDMIELE